MQLIGRARDIVSPSSGDRPLARAEDSFAAWLEPDRTIAAIEADPPRSGMSGLVGQRGGGGLRRALEDTLPMDRRNGTPLSLILDDISGTSLVAGWAWSLWDPNWLENTREALKNVDLEKAFKSREGVCIGFAPGSGALNPDTERSRGTPAPDLRNPDDPDGWHAFTVQNNVGMRRARRIDVWLDQVIVIDSAFQDSASTPEGGRAVVHEYRLRVTADPTSLRLLSIDAEPRILPFVECVGAKMHLPRLLDTPLPELRVKVLGELRGIAGCTHLNDALRALADVPTLLRYLNDGPR